MGLRGRQDHYLEIVYYFMATQVSDSPQFIRIHHSSDITQQHVGIPSVQCKMANTIQNERSLWGNNLCEVRRLLWKKIVKGVNMGESVIKINNTNANEFFFSFQQ